MYVPEGLTDQILDLIRTNAERYPDDSLAVQAKFLRYDLQNLLEDAFDDAESDRVNDLEKQIERLGEAAEVG